MGAREIVMVAIALVALYFAYVLLRLLRLPRKPRPAPREPEPEYHTVLDLQSHTPSPAPQTLVPEVARPVAEPAPVEPSPSDAQAAREHFDAAFELARVRRQLQLMQETQDRLAAEVQALRDEIEVLRAARNVSPQYGEALLLAQRGLSSEAIAERCGISVSEAELVAALARGDRTQEG